MYSEEFVRDLVERAVELARNTTPGNMCNEAVVQRIMKDRYAPGRGWVSSLFDEPTEQELEDNWINRLS